MSIDSRMLRNFLAIVESGSFTKGGELVGLSQPALSASIAQLEHVLHVKLFERSKKGATPTEFGRALIRHAQASEATLARAEREIELKQISVLGPVVVGGTPVALFCFVPPALHMLRESVGPVAAELLELRDNELLPMLRSERIEFAVGVVDLDAPPPDINEEVLMRAPYGVLMSPTHPLVEREEVTLEELVGESWAMPARSGAFRRHLESLFMLAGLPFPSRTFECNSVPIQKELVRTMGVVAILPLPIVQAEVNRGELNVVPLAPNTARRAFGVITLKGRELSPLSSQLLDAVRTRSRQFGAMYP